MPFDQLYEDAEFEKPDYETSLETEKHKTYLQSIKKIIKTVEGKHFFRVFLEKNRLFIQTFNRDSVRQTDFNEGMRHTALRMLSDISEADPISAAEIIIKEKGSEK